MILSNFTPLGSVNSNGEKILLAEVTVTTYVPMWNPLATRVDKTERRKVFRGLGGHWKFVDTGEYCPDYQCENLENAHRGQAALAALQSNNGTMQP
jgi:hypothetical protein